ncbi:hypothetical protein ABPG72_020920 [Tetrahymena utriculariae]
MQQIDQIKQQPNQQSHQILETSFQLSFQDKTYAAYLQVIDSRLEISIEILEQSQFNWKELYSIEQIYKLNKFFLQCKDLNEAYEIISKIMKNSLKSISTNKILFTLQLHQCEINTNDVVAKLCKTISTLQVKSNNQQKQLEQIIKDQSTQSTQNEQIKNLLAKQNEQMKDLAQQMQSLKAELSNQVQKIKNEITSNQHKIFSNIMSFEDGEIIKKWCQINTNEIVSKLCENISTLQIKSNNQQKQLEQMLKDQSTQSTQIEQIKDILVKQNEQMKEYLAEQIQSLKRELQNQIKETKNEIALIKPKMFSNILSFEDVDIIQNWVTDQKINLKLIYRATLYGFQIEKIYEQCKNKSKVILLIQTKEGRRFGFYADCQIKNYNKHLAQNPNNIFLFSLDLKQKYTSNESNCPSAFCSHSSYIAVGGGFDICLWSNSNANINSYVNQKEYGKKEGLTFHALNGGTKYFKTSEIEIFEFIHI